MMTFDLIEYIWDQMEWSKETFGPQPRINGCLDHIQKELAEIKANPTDLEEWIDVVILALDGAWRSSSAHTPEAIAAMLKSKQVKNAQRKWPDWRAVPADKAIEHVREGAE